MDGFDSFPEEITEWETVRDLLQLDLITKNDNSTVIPKVQHLPRQDFILYGTIPKLQQKIYTKCKGCKQIFNPRNVFLHKNCTDGLNSSFSTQKIKYKKSHLPPPPLFNHNNNNNNKTKDAEIPTKLVIKTTEFSPKKSIKSHIISSMQKRNKKSRKSPPPPNVEKSNDLQAIIKEIKTVKKPATPTVLLSEIKELPSAVYMPISPINFTEEIVKIDEKKLVKQEKCVKTKFEPMKTVKVTTIKSVLFPINNHYDNYKVKFYKSHPKPVAIPCYGMRKFNNAGLMLKKSSHIEMQRNDILMAIKSSRKLLGLTGSNVLKNKTKGDGFFLRDLTRFF